MRDRKLISGWVGVGLSTLITCLWAFWGIIENFHEGWFYPSLIRNLALMFVQYLSPMLIVMALALAALRWPRFGGSVYALVGLAFSVLIFSSRSAINARVILSWLPVTALLVFVGILYWYGRPKPRKLAYVIAIGLPLFVTLIFAAEPVYRVAGRVDDDNPEARLVEGNGVTLIWAPQGPGWPSYGVSWEEAQRRCRYLAEDGTTE